MCRCARSSSDGVQHRDRSRSRSLSTAFTGRHSRVSRRCARSNKKRYGWQGIPRICATRCSDTRPSVSSARTRASSRRAHRFSSLSDFLRIFRARRPRPRGTRRVDSRPSSARQKLSPLLPLFHSTSSSLLYLATSVLKLIPGDPSTRVVASVNMQEVFFFYRREKGSPSRRIGVFSRHF